jgi:16S rRNA (guanine527-N7)-methyltransferase
VSTATGRIVAEGAAAVGRPLSAAQCERLASYAELVVRWNRYANLTGAREAGEFAGKFIADALAIAPFVRGNRLADLGSGSGLPGLVLAILEPGWQVTLIEARGRRARFLQQARIDLELPNVEVVQARIEHWQPATPPDTIVCQAVGSLSMILDLTTHLQTPEGRVLALKGRIPEAEIEALGRFRRACTVHALDVPGWLDRHVVVVECAELAALR